MMRIQHLIPVSFRRYLLSGFQNLLWPRYFKQYIRVIQSDNLPDSRLIKKLVYAWGNQGYSAQTNYIETCLQYASKPGGGIIFECGSGLSTLLLGVIGKHRKRKVVSLEEMQVWADKVQQQIDKYNLNQNNLYCKSLISYGDFSWYDIAGLEIPEIGLAICDAPAGNLQGARKGFLYIMKEKMLQNSAILVDDTIREDEQKMIKEWQDIIPLSVEFRGTSDPHAILTIY
jgi:hypothetical protein